jgi:hypothetical protein
MEERVCGRYWGVDKTVMWMRGRCGREDRGREGVWALFEYEDEHTGGAGGTISQSVETWENI